MGRCVHMPVARIGELAPGDAKQFRFGVKNGIAYNDAGTVKAYLNFCPHAGGTVALKNKVFQCRLHQATFDPHTGKRLSGQAGEGSCLLPIELIVEGEMIYAVYQMKDESS